MPPLSESMPSAPNQAPNPMPQPPRSTRALWTVAIVILVVVIAGVAALKFTTANSDRVYICTKTVQTNTACANGSWSDWQTTSQSTTDGVTTTQQQRTYTGTRSVSQQLQYESGGSTCDAGYTASYVTRASVANQPANSITTSSSACQIAQTQTLTSGGSGGGGGSSAQISSVQTDISGHTSSSVQGFSSQGQMNAASYQGGTSAWSGNLSANLIVKPSLVRKGETTQVTWQSNAPTCTVSGTNGDSWTSASSSKTSSAIQGQTIYTLDCPIDAQTSLNAQAKVDIIPSFQEQ